MIVKYGGSIFNSYTNGEGCRYVVFLAGCPHACKGCHNEHLWDINNGEDKDIEEIFKEIDKAAIICDGITISGGDPFMQLEVTLSITEYAKSKGLNVWIYTGYTYDYLKSYAETYNCQIYNAYLITEILDTIDVLVDGEFVEELYDDSLRYRGSSNQRIIKIREEK